MNETNLKSFKLNELIDENGWKGSFKMTDPKTHITTEIVSGSAKFLSPAFYSFIFGGFYLLFHRMWGLGLVLLILSIITSGFSNFFYPFFAKKMLVQHYLKEGFEITAYTPNKRKLNYKTV